MQIELLDTFLDILETRNFNRTAERLNMTQSSVSARIRSLEGRVGARLFDRGRSGAVPTAAGLRFEQHARLLRASWDHAKRDTGAGHEVGGRLRLAGQFSLVRSILIDWIVALRQANPLSALDLQAEFSPQIIRGLSLGAADIGVMFAPQYLPDLDIQQIGLEHFTMVSTHAASMEDVRTEDYIYTGYTSHFDRRHEQVLPGLAHAGVSVGHEDLSAALLKKLGGTTYFPHALSNELVSSGAGLCLVQDAPTIEQPVYTAVHVRRRHDPLVRQALAILGEIFETASKSRTDLNEIHAELQA